MVGGLERGVGHQAQLELLFQILAGRESREVAKGAGRRGGSRKS